MDTVLSKTHVYWVKPVLPTNQLKESLPLRGEFLASVDFTWGFQGETRHLGDS
jgi:hypothetical protein